MDRICIKNLMHQCIDMEKEDRHLTFQELHGMIDRFFDFYNDKILYDAENSEEYYLYVENYSLGHPMHILLTVMTLLFAGVKKIWLECARSYDDGETFEINNELVKHLLGEIVARFPQIHLRSEISYENVHRSGIEFVNQNKNIRHVVLLGGYLGSYCKIAEYRKDVTIHLPTAVQVWVNYSSIDKIYADDKFLEFGKNGWFELYDYECHYSKTMRELESDEQFVGLGYNDFWDWQEYQICLDERKKKEENMADIIPMYLFGDEENVKECANTMPEYHRAIIPSEVSICKIDYNFLDLLKTHL